MLTQFCDFTWPTSVKQKEDSGDEGLIILYGYKIYVTKMLQYDFTWYKYM